MYVTDVPVMDRLTTPGVAEIDAATEALETAFSDLEGWIEEVTADPEERPTHYYGIPPTVEEVHKGLLDALGAAHAAFGYTMDALDLAGVPTL